MSSATAKKTSKAQVTEVESATVGCDGGGGPLGHPKIYLTLVAGEVSCPYCGQHFKLKAGAKVGGH